MNTQQKKHYELYIVSLLPLFCSFLYVFLSYSFELELHKYFLDSTTFGENISFYSNQSEYYQISILCHIVIYPFQSIYWWVTGPNQIDISRFKKSWHFELGTFFLLIFTTTFWFIPAKQTGMTRSLVSLYDNPLAFYLIFLMPITLSSLLITRYLKHRIFTLIN